MKKSLEMLVDSAQAETTKLEKLQETVDQLRAVVETPSINTELQATLQGIVSLAEQGKQKIWETKILNGLYFVDMHGRFDSVAIAHSNTFQWIFEDKITDHQQGLRESFRYWLSSGDGIFHVSGKLGSGKSTLIKFLCERPETKLELEKWAGTSPPGREGIVSIG